MKTAADIVKRSVYSDCNFRKYNIIVVTNCELLIKSITNLNPRLSRLNKLKYLLLLSYSRVVADVSNFYFVFCFVKSLIIIA